MKIKNNGKKIVHVGITALMPGDEITVADVVAQAPAIQILAKHNILTLTADDVKPAKAKEETPAVTVAEITETPAAETPAEAETKAETPAKKTRTKAATAAE